MGGEGHAKKNSFKKGPAPQKNEEKSGESSEKKAMRKWYERLIRRQAPNVSVQGQKYLGAVIGSRDYLEEYVNGKVNDWVREVTQLAEFALSRHVMPHILSG